MSTKKSIMSSEELYALCRAGEKKGWEEANRVVFGYLNWKEKKLSWDTKEEINGEVLSYMAEKIIQGQIEEPKAFRSLMIRKTNWLIQDLYRKRKGMIVIPLPEGGNDDEDQPYRPEIPSDIPSPEEACFWKQAAEIYELVISTLKPYCKELLRIFFLSSAATRELEEIARIQGEDYTAVRTRYYRCREDFLAHPRIVRLEAEMTVR